VVEESVQKVLIFYSVMIEAEPCFGWFTCLFRGQAGGITQYWQNRWFNSPSPMKKISFISLVVFSFVMESANAQTAVNSTPLSPPTQTIIGYQVGEQDANSRQWQKIVKVTDARGNFTFQTNLAYVELASGLNYWDATSQQWLPTKEEIDAYPGGAIAQYGQHKVVFANNLNTSGAIDLQMSDGQELQSEILGLSYHDTASGQSVLIAEVQNSQGQIVSSNEVLYPDAFKGVKASVLYKYTLAGLEQDVILLTQLPSPESFGLSSTSCVLQVLTEFTAAPVPTIRTLPSAAKEALPDEMLDFGAMTMIRGRAFLLGTNAPVAAISKQWLTVSNRTVLVEFGPAAGNHPVLVNVARLFPDDPQTGERFAALCGFQPTFATRAGNGQGGFQPDEAGPDASAERRLFFSKSL
jgi:hypothetical protein